MIESVYLMNFRKHAELGINFDDQFNLICGRNNAGKTTFFYAIEYALFGSVSGFKSLSQLAKFNAKEMGVELTFRDKDGELYKLQRMHKLKIPKKSRNSKSKTKNSNTTVTGYFTLKKVNNDNEKYILASDHGNREDQLSLKINELTGISKRFFETGIHFYQGSISEILAGSKKLDIVFGITAASALTDLFKARALDFEKESKEVDTLKIWLETSKKEKIELQKKSANQVEKINELNDLIQKKNNNLKNLEEMKSFSDEMSSLVESYEIKLKDYEENQLKTDISKKDYEDYIGKNGDKETRLEKIKEIKKILEKIGKDLAENELLIEKIYEEIRSNEKNKSNIENSQKNLNDLIKEIESTTNNFGEIKELNSKLEVSSKKIKEILEKITNAENEIVKNQEIIRDSEREKGDINGILTRRINSKDSPNCEYCGASIDPKKIKDEIENLTKVLERLDKNIEDNDKKISKLKEELQLLRKEEKELSENISDLGVMINKLTDLIKKKSELEKDGDLNAKLSAVSKQLLNFETEIESKKEKTNEIRKMEKNNSEILHELENQAKQFEILESKFIDSKENLKESSKQLASEKDTLIRRCIELKKKIAEIVADNVELENSEDNLFHLAEIIANKIGITEETFSFDEIKINKDELKELVLTKNTKITTELQMLSDQLTNLKGDIKDIEKSIMNLDKQIASNEKKILLLMKKLEIAEKYRHYQKLFKSVQTRIRENLASALEQRIINFHQMLSVDDEFEAISIDKENYSLSVKPKDSSIDEFYPAVIYQGGGHKLILGLSYKLALGDLMGSISFLLIDEPTEFMDVNNRSNLLQHLNNIVKAQILLITHQDVDKINANKLIEIKK